MPAQARGLKWLLLLSQVRSLHGALQPAAFNSSVTLTFPETLSQAHCLLPSRSAPASAAACTEDRSIRA